MRVCELAMVNIHWTFDTKTPKPFEVPKDLLSPTIYPTIITLEMKVEVTENPFSITIKGNNDTPVAIIDNMLLDTYFNYYS